ncbi:hypothetical protein M758_3G216800 [Ceratodon purpureus]|nr:hypothetical protein M758_3G216800 [Ceratodon purpureus]
MAASTGDARSQSSQMAPGRRIQNQRVGGFLLSFFVFISVTCSGLGVDRGYSIRGRRHGGGIVKSRAYRACAMQLSRRILYL